MLGQTTTWLIQRKSDRTFQIEFGAPGEANQRETGRWAVDGQTYTTITSTINGKAIEPLGRQFTDVYLLRDVTSNSMTYYHVRMNLTFKSVKVACVNGD